MKATDIMPSFYDVAKESILDSFDYPEAVYVYAPLSSRRGRLLNRIRALFRLEPRMELVAILPDTVKVALVDNTNDTITVRWDKSGRFEVDD